MRSPFPYQSPLRPDHLTGRKALLKDLHQRIIGNRVTALIGPRRFGKTSVMRRLADDLKNASYEVVWVDLYGVASLADMAVRFDRGLHDITTSWRDTLAKLAASMQFSIGGVAVSLRGRERPDPATTLESLLDVFTTASQSANVVLMIDEFSAIADVPQGAAILRTALQHHYDTIGLLFAGSEPSVMRALFTDRAEPFYGQADLVRIEPLSQTAVISIVTDGFASTSRDAGPAAEHIWRVGAGHPQRTMQLADALWRLTPEHHTATDMVWAEALATVSQAEAMSFAHLYNSLPPGHGKVLRLLSTNDALYGRAAQTLDLPNSTARAAVHALAAAGHITQSDNPPHIIDPLFELWLQHRFAD